MTETGRPQFQPTPETERICSLGVAFGLTHEQIAKLVGCSPKTLRKHFSHALETGKEKLVMSLGTFSRKS
jgi:DNA-directed RNA polymerase specialized sigma24 family protein